MMFDSSSLRRRFLGLGDKGLFVSIPFYCYDFGGSIKLLNNQLLYRVL